MVGFVKKHCWENWTSLPGLEFATVIWFILTWNGRWDGDEACGGCPVSSEYSTGRTILCWSSVWGKDYCKVFLEIHERTENLFYPIWKIESKRFIQCAWEVGTDCWWHFWHRTGVCTRGSYVQLVIWLSSHSLRLYILIVCQEEDQCDTNKQILRWPGLHCQRPSWVIIVIACG